MKQLVHTTRALYFCAFLILASYVFSVAHPTAAAVLDLRAPPPFAHLTTTTTTRMIDCTASDKNLLMKREMVCRSLTQSNTWWCGPTWSNISAHTSWCDQAVYLHELLLALISKDTCLNTTFAKDTVNWLNDASMSDPKVAGNFMWTYLVFQVQYYDMPRKPGERIESPWTLGQKCWAFAYLKQFWDPESLNKALSAAGLQMHNFTAEYEKAIPLTVNLCVEVMNNCFVNASYDPSRKGHCKPKIFMFHMGFDYNNLRFGGVVKYPW